ncbi:MAG: ribosome biogenesis GTPase Der [Clostridiales bacterium]|nr:ribosome biogenesis GTPase Der [Clostridiales bacterium]
MAKPIVAIVGRPNVGKSTFFNYISGRRIAIVEETPGVTRDRIYADVEWRGRVYALVDTGGIEPDSDDPIMAQMRRQAQMAIDTADAILFMVDARDGLTSADKDVADLLRRSGKPLIVVANKADRPGPMPAEAYEFYDLAVGEVLAISSVQGLGMGDLLDAIHACLPPEDGSGEEGGAIKVAIVGKPNVGKSSLVNRMLGEERVITNDAPGTTRDAIDASFEVGGDRFVFIDTAGIRRKSKVSAPIERYSVMRAWAAVERADLCLVVIDAEEGVTEQDAKIAGYAREAGKGVIVLVNKWDLIKKDTGTADEYRARIREKLAFISYAPVMFISALTGQRVRGIFGALKSVYANAGFRAPTGLLNDTLIEAVATAQPPSDRGKRLKIYYMAQIGVRPPSFVVFVNDADLMHYSYARYIENTLRRAFNFEGVPIRLVTRERGEGA